MSTILSIENLTKKYGNYTAVKNLCLKVNSGEIYGFLGPNGAGKTTTIECILGLKKYKKGTITINITNGFEEIGVQFQETKYHNKIKVYESLELMASLYKNTSNYNKLIERFGLKEKTNNFVEDLSGGERQKLSLVLSLINNPQIVFLDELTTGLDPEARREVWTILKELKQSGLTIFLTSHYMDEVTKLCDRITIISKGKEVVTGDIKTILAKSDCDNLEDAYLKYVNGEVM